MATLPQITSPPQASAEVVVNENLEALEHQAVYAEAYLTTNGLTAGYYGGRWGGFLIAAGTNALTASQTNYVVVAIVTGVRSVSTATTNWNDITNYVRVYKYTTSATAITATEDHRAGPGGVYGGSGSPGPPGGSVATDAIWDVAGDLVQGTGANTAARLPIGTALQVLRVNAGATAVEWAADVAGSVATDAIWDVAGDLLQGTGANTGARLPIGTALQVLRVNAGATAVEWAAAAAPTTTPVLIQLACSDETTALTTGVGKITFRAPYAFTITDVRASVTTAPTGGTLLTVDVNDSGTTILSTKLTFDASEKTTTTAATPRVISDSAIADDAEITIDIDAVGSTIAGAGLKVTLLGTKP